MTGWSQVKRVVKSFVKRFSFVIHMIQNLTEATSESKHKTSSPGLPPSLPLFLTEVTDWVTGTKFLPEVRKKTRKKREKHS